MTPEKRSAELVYALDAVWDMDQGTIIPCSKEKLTAAIAQAIREAVAQWPMYVRAVAAWYHVALTQGRDEASELAHEAFTVLMPQIAEQSEAVQVREWAEHALGSK